MNSSQDSSELHYQFSHSYDNVGVSLDWNDLFELHCLLLHSYDKECVSFSGGSWETHVEQLMHRAADNNEYQEYLYRYVKKVRNGFKISKEFYGIPLLYEEYVEHSKNKSPITEEMLLLEESKEVNTE